MTNPTVLVTGGAGYIGSHTCVELLQSRYGVVVLDNLANASKKSIDAVERITQREIDFVEGDIRDTGILDSIFSTRDISAVLHFAGLKAVGESVERPTLYYDNNVHGSLNLLNAMQRHDCRTIVFSSSATVYGISNEAPIGEDATLDPINPYGRSKLMIEEMLRDLYDSDPSWRISILRYFNPVGAHASGEIGEDPNGRPNNLMPFVSQVAVGKRAELSVFGNDYPTPDGTGVRDYIHVVDLAHGHLKALEHLADAPKCTTHNLGTGQGYSVLEIVEAFKQASGRDIPYKIVDRRAGDGAVSFANPAKANTELNWHPKYGLNEMCADAWRWQHSNPNGYDDPDE